MKNIQLTTKEQNLILEALDEIGDMDDEKNYELLTSIEFKLRKGDIGWIV